ncbi:phosphoadenosine phosphosulfate reductase [Actinobaculum sp. 352]|uniref:phosphoadenosine phosphosulfate reductase n=1 Tax=Actinobaculum sp. 352 TaxID=2490946 RepID=UPI000F7DBF0F|nr:phosphoadenosine phosphosulfate reductase [Actinobaculum sp. 352]RTE47904.1 phosphoadenosine phosphosulfate reductase [Actinobaculum sp. 352]
MPTIIKGQPTSAEIIAQLKAENRPVCVSMSLGKDAIACELALAEAGVETVLAYMYPVPPDREGRLLDFLEDDIAMLEDKLGKRIHRYPHPFIFRALNNFVFQPPERLALIEAAQFPTPDYETLWYLIRQDLGLEEDTWIADGVRAADSIVRRASFVRHGVMKPATRKVSPIADYLKAEVLDIINRHGISLPVDYEWFGRSFDGLDYRFLGPLREHAPADYQRVLDWFPLAELEIFRHNMMTKENS